MTVSSNTPPPQNKLKNKGAADLVIHTFGQSFVTSQTLAILVMNLV